MEKELISIIIPVYNTEQYLRKCLDSVINQTYTNLEIILVDDGSIDNSGKICDEYALKDKRIIVIHKQNGGLSSARNEGLKIAKGDYIGFVDSDDYCSCDMYEILYKTIKLYNVDISSCGYYFVREKNIEAKIDIKDGLISQVSATEQGFKQIGFFAWNKLFNKNLFIDVLFPIGFLFEDMFTISKLYMKVKKIAFSHKSCYYYNQLNTNSLTKNKFNIKKLDYFKASKELLNYAININNKKLYKLIIQERAYHICGFLRQIIETNFSDRKIINSLIKKLRQNIFLHLVSRHKLSNKLFGLCCCINFNLSKFIYILIFKFGA